jgi:phosphocarrier protein HPr
MTKTAAKNLMAKGYFVILNDRGLHTRPSTELVKCASTFKSIIHLVYQKQTVNAKSLLGILILAASRGAKIHVKAEGEDAKEAVKAILELAQNHFYTEC